MKHVFIGKFSLGQVVGTPGVMQRISEADRISALTRHISGDWGNLSAHDAECNEEALHTGDQIMSVYESSEGVKFWIITEADRSVTTFLLPEEY